MRRVWEGWGGGRRATWSSDPCAGPAQRVFEWGGGGGAKDECVSQIGVGGGGLRGACLIILILIPLNDGKCIYK